MIADYTDNKRSVQLAGMHTHSHTCHTQQGLWFGVVTLVRKGVWDGGVCASGGVRVCIGRWLGVCLCVRVCVRVCVFVRVRRMGPSTERRGDDGVRVAGCGRQDGMIDERTNSGRAWASGKGVWLGEIRGARRLRARATQQCVQRGVCDGVCCGERCDNGLIL